MPLNAAIRQVLWPIVAIGHACAGFLQVFSLSTCTKRLQVDPKAPVFNRYGARMGGSKTLKT